MSILHFKRVVSRDIFCPRTGGGEGEKCPGTKKIFLIFRRKFRICIEKKIFKKNFPEENFLKKFSKIFQVFQKKKKKNFHHI